MKTYLYIAISAVLAASSAAAATVNETDFAGGFSSPNQYFNPSYTAIGFGIDTINGSLTPGNFDFINLTSLDPGAQTISMDVTLDASGFSPTAFVQQGGELRYGFSGVGSPTNPGLFQLGANYLVVRDPFAASSSTQTLSFNLDSSFAGGDLFLNLIPQFGSGPITYSIAPSGNGGGLAPIPLPATGWMLISAIGAAGLMRRRKTHTDQGRIATA